MTRLLRNLAAVRATLTGVAALLLIAAAIVAGFARPERESLATLYLTTGVALLADPRRHGRATDPETDQ